MHRWVGILGILFVLGLAYLMSTNRSKIRYKTVAWGLGLQIALAFFVMRWTVGQFIFGKLGKGAEWLLDFSYHGSEFVFGELGMKGSPRGFIFAFQALPIIIFIAAFFALLYHWGVMQVIVKAAAKVMTRLMGASGAESLNVAASIFMGQTEAPLTIRPFLPEVTRSELMTIMTSGMAHVSGSLMGAYMAYGIHAEHLLAAVIMTAPGTILVAKMMVPETRAAAHRRPRRNGGNRKAMRTPSAPSRAAPCDGLHLALNVGAMLISFIALVYLARRAASAARTTCSPRTISAWFPSSLEQIFGWVFLAGRVACGSSLARLLAQSATLMGLRMVTNELVAFQRLGPMQGALDPRSFTIATFALCGFANFSSIGIQIGGIGALAPNKRSDLARLGIRAMLAGTMANLMSASLVGIMLR